MTFYAAINIRADIKNGNRGFTNTWEIARFVTQSERDTFVERECNRMAKAVTRKAAEEIFASNYLSIGKVVPKGGLFARNRPTSMFYGE